MSDSGGFNMMVMKSTTDNKGKHVLKI